MNFEDERLVGFDKNDFVKLLEIYYEISSPNKNKKIFLFLDEIQNIAYWEKWINRLYEENKFKIFKQENYLYFIMEMAVEIIFFINH